MAELPFLRRRALLNSSHVIGEAATKADWRGCVRRTFSIRINGSGVCASNDAEAACRPHTAAKGGPPLRKKNTTVRRLRRNRRPTSRRALSSPINKTVRPTSCCHAPNGVYCAHWREQSAVPRWVGVSRRRRGGTGLGTRIPFAAGAQLPALPDAAVAQARGISNIIYTNMTCHCTWHMLFHTCNLNTLALAQTRNSHCSVLIVALT